jgi:hypothetical protein
MSFQDFVVGDLGRVRAETVLAACGSLALGRFGLEVSLIYGLYASVARCNLGAWDSGFKGVFKRRLERLA